MVLTNNWEHIDYEERWTISTRRRWIPVLPEEEDHIAICRNSHSTEQYLHSEVDITTQNQWQEKTWFALSFHIESNCPDNDYEPERLVGENAALFRSALGLILYIAQDRVDIQFSTKVLATYMAHPCVKAMAAIKHLALYLDGTADAGIFFEKV